MPIDQNESRQGISLADLDGNEDFRQLLRDGQATRDNGKGDIVVSILDKLLDDKFIGSVTRSVPAAQLCSSLLGGISLGSKRGNEQTLRASHFREDSFESAVAAGICDTTGPESLRETITHYGNKLAKYTSLESNQTSNRICRRIALLRYLTSVLRKRDHSVEKTPQLTESSQSESCAPSDIESSSEIPTSFPLRAPHGARFLPNHTNRPETLEPGTLVVRGEHWHSWDNTDGGPGNVGTVVQMCEYESQTNCGVIVRWGQDSTSNENDHTGRYRWGFRRRRAGSSSTDSSQNMQRYYDVAVAEMLPAMVISTWEKDLSSWFNSIDLQPDGMASSSCSTDAALTAGQLVDALAFAAGSSRNCFTKYAMGNQECEGMLNLHNSPSSQLKWRKRKRSDTDRMNNAGRDAPEACKRRPIASSVATDRVAGHVETDHPPANAAMRFHKTVSKVLLIIAQSDDLAQSEYIPVSEELREVSNDSWIAFIKLIQRYTISDLMSLLCGECEAFSSHEVKVLEPWAIWWKTLVDVFSSVCTEVANSVDSHLQGCKSVKTSSSCIELLQKFQQSTFFRLVTASCSLLVLSPVAPVTSSRFVPNTPTPSAAMTTSVEHQLLYDKLEGEEHSEISHFAATLQVYIASMPEFPKLSRSLLCISQRAVNVRNWIVEFLLSRLELSEMPQDKTEFAPAVSSVIVAGSMTESISDEYQNLSAFASHYHAEPTPVSAMKKYRSQTDLMKLWESIFEHDGFTNESSPTKNLNVLAQSIDFYNQIARDVATTAGHVGCVLSTSLPLRPHEELPDVRAWLNSPLFKHGMRFDRQPSEISLPEKLAMNVLQVDRTQLTWLDGRWEPQTNNLDITRFWDSSNKHYQLRSNMYTMLQPSQRFTETAARIFNDTGRDIPSLTVTELPQLSHQQIIWHLSQAATVQVARAKFCTTIPLISLFTAFLDAHLASRMSGAVAKRARSRAREGWNGRSTPLASPYATPFVETESIFIAVCMHHCGARSDAFMKEFRICVETVVNYIECDSDSADEGERINYEALRHGSNPPTSAWSSIYAVLSGLRKFLWSQRSLAKSGMLSKAFDVTLDGPTNNSARAKNAREQRETARTNCRLDEPNEVPTSMEDVIAFIRNRCMFLLCVESASGPQFKNRDRQKENVATDRVQLTPLLSRWKSSEASDQMIIEPLDLGQPADATSASATQLKTETETLSSKERSLLQVCLLYCKYGAKVSPNVLVWILLYRQARASLKSFALCYWAASVRAVMGADNAFMDNGYSDTAQRLDLFAGRNFPSDARWGSGSSSRLSCVRELLRPLRASFSGAFSWKHIIRKRSHQIASSESRTHCLWQGIEGIPTEVMQNVRSNWADMYVGVAAALASAARIGDCATAAISAWCWNLELGERDHEMILRTGIWKLLTDLASSTAGESDSILRSLDFLHATNESSPHSERNSTTQHENSRAWVPLDAEILDTAINEGTMSAAQVIDNVLEFGQTTEGELAGVSTENGNPSSNALVQFWQNFGLNHTRNELISAFPTGDDVKCLYTAFLSALHDWRHHQSTGSASGTPYDVTRLVIKRVSLLRHILQRGLALEHLVLRSICGELLRFLACGIAGARRSKCIFSGKHKSKHGNSFALVFTPRQRAVLDDAPRGSAASVLIHAEAAATVVARANQVSQTLDDTISASTQALQASSMSWTAHELHNALTTLCTTECVPALDDSWHKPVAKVHLAEQAAHDCFLWLILLREFMLPHYQGQIEEGTERFIHVSHLISPTSPLRLAWRGLSTGSLRVQRMSLILLDFMLTHIDAYVADLSLAVASGISVDTSASSLRSTLAPGFADGTLSLQYFASLLGLCALPIDPSLSNVPVNGRVRIEILPVAVLDEWARKHFHGVVIEVKEPAVAYYSAGFHSGFHIASLGASVLSILRKLIIQWPSGRQFCWEMLARSEEACDAALESSLDSEKKEFPILQNFDLRAAYAVSAVLGGFTDLLRPGVRAVPSSAWQSGAEAGHWSSQAMASRYACRIVRYERGDMYAWVMYPPSSADEISRNTSSAKEFGLTTEHCSMHPALELRRVHAASLTPLDDPRLAPDDCWAIVFPKDTCSKVTDSIVLRTIQKLLRVVCTTDIETMHEHYDHDHSGQTNTEQPNYGSTTLERKFQQHSSTGFTAQLFASWMRAMESWLADEPADAPLTKLLVSQLKEKHVHEKSILQFLTELACRAAPQARILCLRYITGRSNIMNERVLSFAYSNARPGYFGGVPDKHENNGQDDASYIARCEAAQELAAMGFDFDLAIKGLEIKSDDKSRVVDWFLSGEAEAFRSGGGLDETTPNDANDPRTQQARDLAMMVGRPPKMCGKALELSGDNANGAMNWLMDFGDAFMPGISEEIGSTTPSHFRTNDLGDTDDRAILDDLGISRHGSNEVEEEIDDEYDSDEGLGLVLDSSDDEMSGGELEEGFGVQNGTTDGISLRGVNGLGVDQLIVFADDTTGGSGLSPLYAPPDDDEEHEHSVEGDEGNDSEVELQDETTSERHTEESTSASAREQRTPSYTATPRAAFGTVFSRNAGGRTGIRGRFVTSRSPASPHRANDRDNDRGNDGRQSSLLSQFTHAQLVQNFGSLSNVLQGLVEHLDEQSVGSVNPADPALARILGSFSRSNRHRGILRRNGMEEQMEEIFPARQLSNSGVSDNSASQSLSSPYVRPMVSPPHGGADEVIYVDVPEKLERFSRGGVSTNDCAACGMVVSIFNGDEGDDTSVDKQWRMISRCGVIAGMDADRDRALVLLVSGYTSAIELRYVPLSQLRFHSHVFGLEINEDATSIEQAYSLLSYASGTANFTCAFMSCRRSILNLMLRIQYGTDEALISSWESWMSVNQLVTLVQLVAASEHALGASQDSGYSNTSSKRISRDISSMADSVGVGVSSGRGGFKCLPMGTPALGAALMMLNSALGQASSMSVQLVPMLVDDVAINITSATTPHASGEAPVVRESLHPHFNTCELRDEVTFPGARALWVTFDPRTQTHPNAQLMFYEQHQVDGISTQPIASLSGDTGQFRPFVVHGSSVRFAFRANHSLANVGWGYKMLISPMQGLAWKDEAHITSHAASLEWACWLMEFLLATSVPLNTNTNQDETISKSSDTTSRLHSGRVFLALVNYLRARGTPFKDRVVRLITQLLRFPKKFPSNDLPDFSALHGLERATVYACRAPLRNESPRVLSKQMFPLVELLIVAKTAERFLRAENKTYLQPSDVVGVLQSKHRPRNNSCISVSDHYEKLLEIWPKWLRYEFMQFSPGDTSIPEETDRQIAVTPLQHVLRDTHDIISAVYLASCCNSDRCRLNSFPLPPLLLARCAVSAGMVTGPEDITHDIMLEVSIQLSNWSLEQDEQLVQWATTITSPARRARISQLMKSIADPTSYDFDPWRIGSAHSPMEINPRAIRLSKNIEKGSDNKPIAPGLPDDSITFNFLASDSLTTRSLRLRIALLQILNRRLSYVLPLLDVDSKGAGLLPGVRNPTGVSNDSNQCENLLQAFSIPIGQKLKAISHCIFVDVKMHVLDSSIAATWSSQRGSGFTARLDNNAAFESREQAAKSDNNTSRSISESKCLFVQLYHSLHKSAQAATREEITDQNHASSEASTNAAVGRTLARGLRAHLDGRESLFKVEYIGEDGMDWGGLYRDCLTRVIDDLFPTSADAGSISGNRIPVSSVDLFLPCPNQIKGVGESGDKWVPNPAHTSPLAMSMFRFVGRLMGVALRHKAYLPFDLSPAIWARIAKPQSSGLNSSSLTNLESHDRSAIMEMNNMPQWALHDTDAWRELQRMLTMSKEDFALMSTQVGSEIDRRRRDSISASGDDSQLNVQDEQGAPASATASAFQLQTNTKSASMTFVFRGSDGKPVELCTGGASRVVSYENLTEFVILAKRMREREFDAQCAAIRKGLVSIVPARALQLLTWRELELSVCGDASVDVALLQQNTVYSGFAEGEHDEFVCRFWRIFESLTSEEQSGFIRFAWGRARLPKPEHWVRPFKLVRRGGGDSELPVSHACFFSVELPCYSTDEIAARRIRTAIQFGAGGEFLIA